METTINIQEYIETAAKQLQIEIDEDGYFIASHPNIPGCISDGRTKEEAIENWKDAATTWLECALEYGDPIPNLE